MGYNYLGALQFQACLPNLAQPGRSWTFYLIGMPPPPECYVDQKAPPCTKAFPVNLAIVVGLGKYGLES